MDLQYVNCTGDYLSENITDFPFAQTDSFQFIDKGKTGCGGTTLVKETTDRIGGTTLCIMPNISSIQSKGVQFREDESVLCVYGMSSLKDAFAFRNGNSKTIFCTYDKLAKYKSTIPSNVRLVVDEYHTITRDADFREVMPMLFSVFAKFPSVTFMSATPDELLIDAVGQMFPERNLTRIVYQWDGYIPKVNIVKIQNVRNYIRGLYQKTVRDENCPNYYIMYNNVKSILDTICGLGISPEEYHFVCSLSRNDVQYRSDINDVNEQHRKINFITSTGFEGCDIEDPNGQIVLIYDLCATPTVCDHQTIIQLNGRCRKAHNTPILAYHQQRLRKEQVVTIGFEKARQKELSRALFYGDNVDIDRNSNYFIKGNLVYINPVITSCVNRKYDTLLNITTYARMCSYLEKHGIRVVKTEDKVSVEIEKKGHKYVPFKKMCEAFTRGEDIVKYRDYRWVIIATKALGEDWLERHRYRLNDVKRSVGDVFSQYSTYALREMDTEQCRGILCSRQQVNPDFRLKFGCEYTLADLTKAVESYNSLTGRYLLSDPQHVGVTLRGAGYKFYVKRGGNGNTYQVIDAPTGSELRLRLAPTSIKGRGANQLCKPVPSLPESGIRFAQATASGRTTSYMRTITSSSLDCTPYPNKEDNYLMSDCYADQPNAYRRRESSFTHADSLLLDVDGGCTEEEFRQFMEKTFKDCGYWYYRSHSWSEYKHKFRVIIPFDRPITFAKFIEESDRIRGGLMATQAFKMFKVSQFPMHDPKAQLWFYTPEGEIYWRGNPNVCISAEYVEDYISRFIIATIANKESKEMMSRLKPKSAKRKQLSQSKGNTIGRVATLENWVKQINTQCVDGNRDEQIFKIVSHCTREEALSLINSVTDEKNKEKIQEKMRYRFG